MDNLDIFASLNKLDDETPAAYTAFMDYVQMGADRSLRKLVEQYRQQKVSKPPTTRLETLADWSRHHRWQVRVSAYLQELQKLNAEKQKEHMESFNANVWGVYRRLMLHVDRVIDEFDESTVVRKTRKPHPTKENVELEIILMKPNTKELTELVKAAGQLGKDVRAQLGLPMHIDVTTMGEKIKGYTNVNPDDWDDDDTDETPS